MTADQASVPFAVIVAARNEADRIGATVESLTWAAISYLVFAGSVAVFGLYVYVLRHWPASRATYAFVLIPFVTVLLSTWLDDEPVGWGLVIGGALVLAGVYYGALRPADRQIVS